MREFAEFRVLEEFAHLLFRDDEGERLGTSVRKVILSTDDPKYPQVGELKRSLRQREGKFFFFGWKFVRKYHRQELDAARLFQLQLSEFEPEGESCGTQFDESTACAHCGAGRRQISDLYLDLRKVPKSRDFTSTIAEEWIVSERLAYLMTEAKLTGFTLAPVRHKAAYRYDPWNPDKVPMQEKWQRIAEEKGLRPDSWEYLQWMLHEMHKEYVAMLERRDLKRPPKELPRWYQLIVTSSAGRTVPPTRFGDGPFDDDPQGENRCPLGHVSGLNLLSEVSVSRSAWDGCDIAITDNLVGCRRGVLVPRPILLASPKFFRLLLANRIKKFRYEVAYLV